MHEYTTDAYSCALRPHALGCYRVIYRVSLDHSIFSILVSYTHRIHTHTHAYAAYSNVTGPGIGIVALRPNTSLAAFRPHIEHLKAPYIIGSGKSRIACLKAAYVIGSLKA